MLKLQYTSILCHFCKRTGNAEVLLIPDKLNNFNNKSSLIVIVKHSMMQTLTLLHF